MQLPILSGLRISEGELAPSYPVNLEPRALESGISKGQQVSARGAEPLSEGPGVDRGGIVWNGTLYRVMGTKLVTVAADGTVTQLGDVGGDGLVCGFDFSFDRLSIRSGDKLFYYDGNLAEVTDPDLGRVLDHVWMDGYFVTTDGEFVVVTELKDPTSVDPFKYGSAETDPDSVTGLLRHREELVVLGRETIQFFQNVGGTGFPFQVYKGATIPYGCVSASAKCIVGVGGGTIAFVGGGRNEPIGLFVVAGGSAQRISDKEIDDRLAKVLAPEMIVLEPRTFGGEHQLLMHLDDATLCLALDTSEKAGSGAWTILQSGQFAPYRPRHAVWAYGKHIVGDRNSGSLGVLSIVTARHFGEAAHWLLDAGMLFEPAGMVAAEIELFGQFGTDASSVFLSVTRDGELWSNEVAKILSGRRGERVVWRPGVHFPTMGGFRFRGTSRVALSRCEIT